LKINPSFPPFAKGRNYPSLEKRGEGRFSDEYVFSISLKIAPNIPPLPSGGED
jgi:hypothetical protein